MTSINYDYDSYFSSMRFFGVPPWSSIAHENQGKAKIPVLGCFRWMGNFHRHWNTISQATFSRSLLWHVWRRAWKEATRGAEWKKRQTKGTLPESNITPENRPPGKGDSYPKPPNGGGWNLSFRVPGLARQMFTSFFVLQEFLEDMFHEFFVALKNIKAQMAMPGSTRWNQEDPSTRWNHWPRNGPKNVVEGGCIQTKKKFELWQVIALFLTYNHPGRCVRHWYV